MNDKLPITEQMRHALKPRGTANISRLQMDDPFVDYNFVLKCIDELEKIPVRAALGDNPSNLEKLAYMLLCDSAFISR